MHMDSKTYMYNIEHRKFRSTKKTLEGLCTVQAGRVQKNETVTATCKMVALLTRALRN